MTVTAFTLGSYGDVAPFVVLGRELQARGYDYRIATYEAFRARVEGAGIPFIRISGDSEEMVSILLSDSGNGAGEGMNGIRYLLNKYPQMYEEFYRACADSDLVIYMQFGSPAYHFAEKFGVPAIRTYVFPFELTNRYCALSDSMKRNSLVCGFKNFMCRTFMANAARSVMNDWRRRLGLRPNGRLHDYTRLRGEKMLTLYQYDAILAPPDPKWADCVCLTGNWTDPPRDADFEGRDQLEAFLSAGEAPVYAGFGSMNYKDLLSLYAMVLETVLEKTDRRIVVPEICRGLIDECFPSFRNRVALVGFVPFDYLFPRVCAAIHHGGNGTTHAALRCGVPQLVMAFGADQMFWGGQSYYLGTGPEPVNVKKNLTKEHTAKQILALLSRRAYADNARKYSRLVSTDGARKAADIIAKRYPPAGKGIKE